MVQITLFAFLLSLLLFVHLTTKREEGYRHCLLNDNLPFLAAGQGSSIFSLTALFGSYLVIMYLIGVYALLGIMIGSVMGLILIQKELSKYNGENFHGFLKNRFCSNEKAGLLFLSFISFTQCGFAVSELIIIRETLEIGLGIDAKYSIYLVIGLMFIVYIYCLQDGYLAVYKTDLLQYIAILLMGGLFFIIPFIKGITFKELNFLGPESDLWSFGKKIPSIIQNGLNFIFGYLMGAGFIIASPDSWKRIFITTKKKNKSSLWYLIGAGILPFILIFPLFFVSGNQSNINSPVEFLMSIYQIKNPILISIILLGFVSSFMSSYDSAMISSVHLISVKHISEGDSLKHERTIFNIRMGRIFLVINLFFWLSLIAFKNPYFVGNFLMCPFAIISGVIIGTNGFKKKLPQNKLLTTMIFALIFWFMYLISIPEILNKSSINQIGTVPVGAFLSIIVAIISYFFSKAK